MDPPAAFFSGRRAALSGVDPAPGVGNTEFDPELAAGLRRRLGGSKGPNLIGWRGRGLPAEGRPRMLVLLVEFDEYPARPGDTPEAMHDRIFGAGGKFPYESLTAFYKRSSYGKLHIDGEVLGWYKAGPRSAVAQTRAGREELIKKALLAYKGHDFSRYDNNGDGQIDYFAVIWTGPVGEWATFWWAVAPRFSDRNFTVGGQKLGSYSWQGVVYNWGDQAADFRINTLAHETGHALGLPDYYDYNSKVGPGGGLGLFDMMDSTRYDHNCFSKLMLGWVEPKVLTSGGAFSLPPAEEEGDCLMLLPPGRERDPFGEFFLVENRRRQGNDTEPALIKGGLVIWHVDAKLKADGSNFLYNNQDTEHKLLKILEADGLEELETKAESSFGFLDFYIAGRALGPDTLPSSRLYDGTDTGISLTSLGGDNYSYFGLKFR